MNDYDHEHNSRLIRSLLSSPRSYENIWGATVPQLQFILDQIKANALSVQSDLGGGGTRPSRTRFRTRRL